MICFTTTYVPTLTPQHSPFFAEQLTAFQVWLTMGVENRNPPEQLPIVLQVRAGAGRATNQMASGYGNDVGAVGVN